MFDTDVDKFVLKASESLFRNRGSQRAGEHADLGWAENAENEEIAASSWRVH